MARTKIPSEAEQRQLAEEFFARAREQEIPFTQTRNLDFRIKVQSKSGFLEQSWNDRSYINRIESRGRLLSKEGLLRARITCTGEMPITSSFRLGYKFFFHEDNQLIKDSFSHSFPDFRTTVNKGEAAEVKLPAQASAVFIIGLWCPQTQVGRYLGHEITRIDLNPTIKRFSAVPFEKWEMRKPTALPKHLKRAPGG